jgi:glycosyltransferase involved in cell wall biosynthesis
MQLMFIIPVKDEKETLASLLAGIRDHSAGHTVNVLFIDDGSVDGSLEELDRLDDGADDVHVIHFVHNLGKTSALQEGFHNAQGDVVFTMDSDLQDDPAEIPNFIEKLEEGYDMVCGWKVNRLDPWHKTIPSKVYNGIVSGLFGLSLHDINCGYKAMTLEVARSLELKHDYHRLIPVLAAKKGYKIGEIEVHHQARQFGRSKYGLSRFWHGARDVLRVWVGR